MPTKRPKKIGEEHWVLRDGSKLDGVYFLDTTKATGDRWDMIDLVINEYTNLHPAEMEMLVHENKAISESRLNKYGSTRKKDIRWGASIPAALLFKLEQVEPLLFADKQLYYAFLNRYKGFRTCKVV